MNELCDFCSLGRVRLELLSVPLSIWEMPLEGLGGRHTHIVSFKFQLPKIYLLLQVGPSQGPLGMPGIILFIELIGRFWPQEEKGL